MHIFCIHLQNTHTHTLIYIYIYYILLCFTGCFKDYVLHSAKHHSQCLLRAPLSFGLFVQALHGEEHVEIYRCLGWSIKNAACGWEAIQHSNGKSATCIYFLLKLGISIAMLFPPKGICSIHMYPCNPNFWVILRLLLTSCLLHDSDLSVRNPSLCQC